MSELVEARERLYTALHRGDLQTCPCCDQKVKLSRRAINASMLKQLLHLARAAGLTTDWVDWIGALREARSSTSGDYAKIRHWGLVEPWSGARSETRTRGHWRLTRSGIAWLKGESAVPKYAHLYNDTCFARSGVDVWRKDLFPEFDGQELMRQPPLPFGPQGEAVYTKEGLRCREAR
jgi:hypothetical protein